MPKKKTNKNPLSSLSPLYSVVDRNKSDFEKNLLRSFYKTDILLGDGSVQLLNDKKVAVFGLGGVGSFVVEALSRSGIGSFVLIDNDIVSQSNLNRQLYALHSTLGKAKVDIAKKRILDINPHTYISIHRLFYLPENKLENYQKEPIFQASTEEKSSLKAPLSVQEAHKILNRELESCDYIVDAVDTISAKIAIIEKARELKIPHLSSMGTGNKLDPSQFKIADIYKTSICPLARIMRYELKKRKIESCKVLYSTEKPLIKTQEPASIAFVPSIAGLLIAREVILDLIKQQKHSQLCYCPT